MCPQCECLNIVNFRMTGLLYVRQIKLYEIGSLQVGQIAFTVVHSSQSFSVVGKIQVFGVCHAHSLSFQSLHPRHSSFSNPSVASPTSQLILQPFRSFTYVTAHSPTFLSLLLRHRIFTYVIQRAAHGVCAVTTQQLSLVKRRLTMVRGPSVVLNI